MSETTFHLKLDFKNSKLQRNFLSLVQETSGFQVMGTDDIRSPDLLIFELSNDTENEFKLIKSLLHNNASGEIFLTSDKTDSGVLMQAIRIGAKEFFSQPINTDDVKKALDEFKKRKKNYMQQAPARSGRIISIMGSKGGVGTTTVAVNLAESLNARDDISSVALLDMNSVFGEIPLFLEISPKFHWGEITKNVERLDETFLMNVMTRHGTGIYVLPSPGYLNGHHAPTPEIMGRLLNLMKQVFDVVIIDGGQSTDETSLKIIQMSDQLLLVSILSLPCLSNTNKLLKSFIDLGFLSKDRIKVVINRHLKKGELSLEDLKSGIKQEPYWTIPNDYLTTMSAINQGKTLAQISPKAPISKNFRKMAESLMVQPERPAKKRWGFFKR